MKKYLLSALAVASAAMFTSCDDMLDVNPRVTEMSQATFPGKPADVEALNTATYSIMNALCGDMCDDQHLFYWWEIMSDNCYGAGGLQDWKVKCLNNLTQGDPEQFVGPFRLCYAGIARANNQIETIDNVDWTGLEAKRNQLLGEAYFMRGLYTFWLTQLFGDVPLVTGTVLTSEMEQQVSAENVIYPQVLSDFVSGMNLMGDAKFAGNGHANKYVAKSFAARAYMFWAGFYKNVSDLSSGSAPAINLVKQEGCDAASLSQADIVEGIKDVINNGGYKLCEDYRSLWQYSNSFVWDEAHDGVDGANKEGTHAYAFIADMKRENCFDQPGMGNGNTEEIFQIQYMNASAWAINGLYSYQRMYCNYLSVFWALRVNGNNGNRDYTYPFTQGWGQGTPSCNLWDDWTIAEVNGSYTDIRKKGSLIDCNNELTEYSYVKDDCEESGYGVKKWNGVTVDALTGDSPWWDVAPGFTGSSLDNPMQGDHFQDFYLMRYADVLLMASELTGDVTYMNQVQARAGVPLTKAYSLKAIQDERRWEFAFEGLRFNDMRRWTGNKPTADSYAPKALQAQQGKLVVSYGDKSNKHSLEHMTSSWTERYIATNGFLAKPKSQILLYPGKIEQNPGWDAADPTTQYKTMY